MHSFRSMVSLAASKSGARQASQRRRNSFTTPPVRIAHRLLQSHRHDAERTNVRLCDYSFGSVWIVCLFVHVFDWLFVFNKRTVVQFVDIVLLVLLIVCLCFAKTVVLFVDILLLFVNVCLCLTKQLMLCLLIFCC